MNDKIGITTNEFEKNNQFELNFSNVIIDFMRETNIGTHNEYQNAFETKKTYCNTDILNVTHTGHNLKIEFNPNRITKTLPNEVLSYSQFVDSFNIVENELTTIGINTNLSKQSIYRFHSSFDILTDNEYDDYIDLIKFSLPISQKIRYNHQFSIENTLYKQLTKNQKICCYDKKALYNKLNDDTQIPNTLRLEYRNENELKINRLSLSNISEKRYYDIRNNHKQIIKSNVLRDYTLETDDVITLLYSLLTNHVKIDKIKNYVLSHLLNKELKERQIDIRDLLFSGIDRDDKPYKRAVQRLIKMLNDYSVFDLSYSRELYTELSYKLNKVA